MADQQPIRDMAPNGRRDPDLTRQHAAMNAALLAEQKRYDIPTVREIGVLRVIGSTLALAVSTVIGIAAVAGAFMSALGITIYVCGGQLDSLRLVDLVRVALVSWPALFVVRYSMDKEDRRG